MNYMSKIKEGNKLMNKTALVTGCTGQDGSFIIEFLLDK